jgi:hypothetical protein
MLPPDISPLHKLIRIWRSQRPPHSHEIAACRARLFEAATLEIIAHTNQSIPYDPLMDKRFCWAAEYLQVADGTLPQISPDTELLCRLLMDPAPMSQKIRAAADTVPE